MAFNSPKQYLQKQVKSWLQIKLSQQTERLGEALMPASRDRNSSPSMTAERIILSDSGSEAGRHVKPQCSWLSAPAVQPHPRAGSLLLQQCRWNSHGSPARTPMTNKGDSSPR